MSVREEAQKTFPKNVQVQYSVYIIIMSYLPEMYAGPNGDRAAVVIVVVDHRLCLCCQI